jgi:hypothetical protein
MSGVGGQGAGISKEREGLKTHAIKILIGNYHQMISKKIPCHTTLSIVCCVYD